MHYFPLALPFLLIFFFLFLFLIVLIEIGVLSYAYRRIGVSRRYAFLLLFLSLLGSYVNIPIARLPPETVHSGNVVSLYGMKYVIPAVINWPGTIIAVNVGGALIPVILSIYLVMRNRLYIKSILAVAVVAAVVYNLATPVPGVGIVEPTLVPPFLTAAVALLISREDAPPLAYVGGSLGTLIGADLLNLGSIQGLGAPVASIGGAGTFDGIFLTGIMAVLLAGIAGRKKPSGLVEET